MVGIAIIFACIIGLADGLRKLQQEPKIKSSNNLVEYLFIDY